LSRYCSKNWKPATARANESLRAFLAIMAEVPGGLPHSEDSLRLKDALRGRRQLGKTR
jgi:hypothetical protein